MENNNIETPLAIVVPAKKTKRCNKCGKTLPIEQFAEFGSKHRSICRSCQRDEDGSSERFAEFTSRELMEELRNRGFKGTLKYTKIEEFNV